MVIHVYYLDDLIKRSLILIIFMFIATSLDTISVYEMCEEMKKMSEGIDQ